MVHPEVRRTAPSGMSHTWRRLQDLCGGVRRQVAALAFDPLDVARKWCAIPFYVRNAVRYWSLNQSDGFRLSFSAALFTSADRFGGAGSLDSHYFLQDLWAARRLYQANVRAHVDVGSRVDGFVSHLLTFAHVTYVDLRPLTIEIDNLDIRRGSILELPFRDQAVASLSCLHVLEHIGLGRYGDPVNPDAYRLAAAELSRVLTVGGEMILSVPVGRERLCFDAHRIFYPETIVELFPELRLVEFGVIPDTGSQILLPAGFEIARQQQYGCGLFVFVRPPVRPGSSASPATSVPPRPRAAPG